MIYFTPILRNFSLWNRNFPRHNDLPRTFFRAHTTVRAFRCIDVCKEIRYCDRTRFAVLFTKLTSDTADQTNIHQSLSFVVGIALYKCCLLYTSVDKYGLDHIDRNILLTMIERFGGGPVGLDTLAASISEDAGTLEDVYEPYLLKHGFIQRTPRGRVATDLAYAHLGIPHRCV